MTLLTDSPGPRRSAGPAAVGGGRRRSAAAAGRPPSSEAPRRAGRSHGCREQPQRIGPESVNNGVSSQSIMAFRTCRAPQRSARGRTGRPKIIIFQGKNLHFLLQNLHLSISKRTISEKSRKTRPLYLRRTWAFAFNSSL